MKHKTIAFIFVAMMTVVASSSAHAVWNPFTDKPTIAEYRDGMQCKVGGKGPHGML